MNPNRLIFLIKYKNTALSDKDQLSDIFTTWQKNRQFFEDGGGTRFEMAASGRKNRRGTHKHNGAVRLLRLYETQAMI